MTAALLAGCADSSRFTGDPLGNPFRTASTDPAPTGSVAPRPGADDMAPPPYRSRTAVVAQPLAPPSTAPRRAASYEPPARTETYAAPRTERTASFAAPSGHGSWSAQGGMAIVAADGETAAILAARYDVPTEALLHANGFTSAAAIRPGTRLVIPVYSANGARLAMSEPVAKPHDHAGRERLAQAIADRKAAKLEAERQASAEREAAADRQAAKDAAKRKTAKRDGDGETMHWKRGPQPTRMGEADPRSQRKAEDTRAARKADADADERRAARQAEREAKQASRKAELEDKRAARKIAKAEEREAQPAPHMAPARMATARMVPARMANVETVPETSARPAREAEAEAPRKAQSDPTPTASLPPAEEKVASGGPEFRWPAHGRIIQGFKSGGNDGINIAVPDGTPVKAAESGVVAYAGNEIKGFGNLVLIRHPNGFVSAYANNGDVEVHRGEQVKRGQVIAKSGQSGNVASPQLHFELRKGSTPVDPTRYLAGL